MKTKTLFAVFLLGTSTMTLAQPPSTAADRTYAFDLPAEPLGDALRAVAAKAGLEMYARADAVGKLSAPRLQGRLTVRAAIEQLLAGTKLRARYADGAVIIEERGSDVSDASDSGPEVVVTASHIRNAPTTGSVFQLTQAQIQNAGQSDLGEAVRSLPANFSGGQNPGVGPGAGLVNTNLNSTSQVNLRGLGPSASLTLLNGRRLPYDSAFQGVDISAFPLAAVDRIEIVADGASALYGSDAVGGVANIILKPDFEGLTTTTRIGGATDGGDFDQQASAVGGFRWKGGGMIAAYEFQHNSGIRGRDRDYTATLPPENSMYPSGRRHAATLSAHQDLFTNLKFSVDTVYDKRWNSTTGGYTIGANTLFAVNYPHVETFAIAPELDLSLSNGWRMKAFGTYGDDTTRFASTSIINRGAPAYTEGCYCNRNSSAEINADGPLFRLPGGPVQIAVGGGFRRDSLDYSAMQNGVLTQSFSASQTVTYGFSELSLPVVSPNLHIPGLYRLVLSAAGRHEHYSHAESITTPKLGFVYEPVRGFSIKGSWGRSFRAPTFYERYVPTLVYLYPATTYGAGPAGTTVLYASGGNPNLTPERSENWSVTAELKPVAVPALTLSATYFHIAYRNRVVQPNSGSNLPLFQNPAYASLLTRNPSAALQQSLISNALSFTNLSGLPYNPATVVAFADNRNLNAASQSIHGVDTAASYRFDLGPNRSISVNVDGSYLASDQQILPGLPTIQRAGILYNPSKYRLRGGTTFTSPRLTLSGFLTYVGKVRDIRYTPNYDVSAKTSVDLVARYRLFGTASGGKSLDVSLIADNVFNTKPATIRVAIPSDVPYDSTNFSPIGRFLAVAISRHW